MATSNMWMVRADSGGRLFDQFKAEGIVAIGWQEMGDFTPLKTREDFAKAVRKAWPEMSTAQVAVATSQAYRFAREIGQGDRAITYDPTERHYLVGTIESDYVFDSTRSEFRNLRKVKWEGSIPRDALSVSTRNSLGAISTLFLIPPDAAKEMEKVLKTGTREVIQTDVQEEISQVDEILKDIQSKAFEFTKDRIARLTWDELQELVAGLLRAMGYKTQVSPPGSDRGKDIVASPDGFGFESPRIVVEVKHRGAAMGSQEIRSFLGGRHKDDKGLYVSTGGFSKEARYEAERANIPVALMDLNDLVKAVLEHYEAMDPDTKRLLPLRKVYWPG